MLPEMDNPQESLSDALAKRDASNDYRKAGEIFYLNRVE